MTSTADRMNAVMAAATDGAALPYFVGRVIFDDGREYASKADQRDQRRAMVALGHDSAETDPVGFWRACAWSYLTRNGVLEISWPDFDRDVAFVTREETETADPTRPATAG
jgi:hypothetical protein